MRTDFSHFGICVSDIDRSVRFYTEALGFAPAESHSIGDEFARLIGLETVILRSQFLRRGPLAIELLGFESPETVGQRQARPMNQLGLTHLSVKVDDVGLVASKITELGGTVLEETRTTIAFAEQNLEFVYCTDPDGVRIELMDLGEARGRSSEASEPS